MGNPNNEEERDKGQPVSVDDFSALCEKLKTAHLEEDKNLFKQVWDELYNSKMGNPRNSDLVFEKADFKSVDLSSAIPGFNFSDYWGPNARNWYQLKPSIMAVIREMSALSLGVTPPRSFSKRTIGMLKRANGYSHAVNIVGMVSNGLLKDSLKSQKKLLFIDIETTSLSPLYGEIIEYGYLLTDSSGNTIEKYEELCGTEDSSIIDRGTILTESITGISYEMIKDKPVFRESEGYSRLVELLMDPDVVQIAHNSAFENSWWSFNIPGFADKWNHNLNILLDKDVPHTLDTRFMAKFCEKLSKQRLQDFAERNGIEYVNAHRALNDVILMKDAYFSSRDRLILDSANKK